MIGEPFNECLCIRRGDPYKLCNGELSLIENGIEVCLNPKRGENACLVVVDGCLVKNTDPHPKCDGIFLLHKHHEKWVITVELKGSDDLYTAFLQLHHTRTNRQIYHDLVRNFKDNDPRNPKEISFIISNKFFSSFDKEKLNRVFKINVNAIAHTAANKPSVDLRKCFN